MRTVISRCGTLVTAFFLAIAARAGGSTQQSTGAPAPDVAALTKACDAGNAVSCTTLGTVYQSGRGATRDVVRAATLYQRACDLKHLEA